jgi:hypothetical protein
VRTLLRIGIAFSLTLALASLAHADFVVPFGVSWEAISLQDVLDAEYGIGTIDAATDYEGYLVGDADPPYWEDLGLDGVIIREIAGFQYTNVMGWYEEDLLGAPAIDGVDDGVIFTGPMAPGAQVILTFPGGITQFGFYLNPQGAGGGGAYAPEPEVHFTNRFYNDIGPSGAGTIHAPTDGDPQCLVYNITHLRNGVKTYVLAWEDLDSGAAIAPAYAWDKTDNDYQDLVVEITAISVVRTQDSTWAQIKSLYDR